MNDSILLFALYGLVYWCGIVTGRAFHAWRRDRAINPGLPPATEVDGEEPAASGQPADPLIHACSGCFSTRAVNPATGFCGDCEERQARGRAGGLVCND